VRSISLLKKLILINLLNSVLCSEMHFECIKMTLFIVCHTHETVVVFFIILTLEKGPKNVYTLSRHANIFKVELKCTVWCIV
jgi:hypothetical protein